MKLFYLEFISQSGIIVLQNCGFLKFEIMCVFNTFGGFCSEIVDPVCGRLFISWNAIDYYWIVLGVLHLNFEILRSLLLFVILSTFEDVRPGTLFSGLADWSLTL